MLNSVGKKIRFKKCFSYADFFFRPLSFRFAPLMTKKIITIFFLTVFLTQLLPLRQVGKLIAGATMTEELPETSSSKSTVGFMDTKWFLTSSHFGVNGDFTSFGQSQYIHFSETLPFLLASDILTPPPNSFC